MISQTSRYALRILGFLVEHPQTRVRADQIAEATGIPANYLSKILNQLRKQGIVDSEKGWGGGFTLRGDAGTLPIGEILKIFEGVDMPGGKECVFGLAKCDADDPCPLHPYWGRVRETLDEMLRDTAVADLGKR